MSGSIGSGEARDAWVNLLAELQDELRRIYPSVSQTLNEEDFRDKFFDLDRERHDAEPAANYAYFSRYHDKLHVFARSVDEAIGLHQPPNLKELFWTITLAAVKVAFDQENDFEDFSAVYEALSEEFPPLNFVELAQYPRNVDVQRCLQLMFEAYCRCYLELIKQIKTAGDNEDINFNPVKTEIEQASQKYKTQIEEWKAQCSEAQLQAQAQAKAKQPKGGLGGLGPNADTRFETLKNLGSGSYGKVVVVRESSSGSVYARKEIPLDAGGQDPKTVEKRVRNEAKIMSTLRHNHIASVNMLFKNDDFWSIIMLPVADCDLRFFLEQNCINRNYPADQIRLLDNWFGCLISALAYAHDESVKHEDIKPSNILIQRKKVFLTDFGTAKDFSEEAASTVSDYLEQGTPIYWAPEPRAWGRAADVFALGCVFSEMLTVRQKRSLAEYRKYRFNPTAHTGYAYRLSLPKVRRWLKSLPDINSQDPVAQTILEQTFNMLIEDSGQRLEAKRLKRNMRVEDQLFCNSCG